MHEDVYDPAHAEPCGDQPVPEVFPYTYLPWGDNSPSRALACPRRRVSVPTTGTPATPAGPLAGAFNADDCTRRFGAVRMISPAGRSAETWNKAPRDRRQPTRRRPDPGLRDIPRCTWYETARRSRNLLDVCAACRQDDNGMLHLLPFGDSDPSHYARSSPAQLAVRFYRNGRLALTSAATRRAAQPVRAQPGDAPRARHLPAGLVPDPAGQPRRIQRHRLDVPVGPGPVPAAPPPPRNALLTPLGAVRSCRCCSSATTWRSISSTQAKAGAAIPHRVHGRPPAKRNGAIRALRDRVSVLRRRQDLDPAARRGQPRRREQFTAMINQPPLSATRGFISLRVAARD